MPARTGSGSNERMEAQRTLRRQISCAGIGLHSGNKVTLTLKPAAADTGIRFRRTDLGVEIPATVQHVTSLQYATVLGKDGATVETVEHLLAALVSSGIDNVVVELNQNEVPIMDGSAAPFLYLVQEAGVKRLSAARTFGFLKEVEWMRQNGLALGGSLENAIVIGDTGVLNALRFEDEFVRHKILDAIGDLALLGYPLIGHVVAHRAGHALHTALVTELLEQRDAWVLVDSQLAPTPTPAPGPLAAPARVAN
jgi:UDP-3-O-[3-hydroxymyristoyl] N-acetylglucosamine deacetylase